MYKNIVLRIFTNKDQDLNYKNNSLFFSINSLFTKNFSWRWPNA